MMNKPAADAIQAKPDTSSWGYKRVFAMTILSPVPIPDNLAADLEDAVCGAILEYEGDPDFNEAVSGVTIPVAWDVWPSEPVAPAEAVALLHKADVRPYDAGFAADGTVMFTLEDDEEDDEDDEDEEDEVDDEDDDEEDDDDIVD
jgi:hypothetical protein